MAETGFVGQTRLVLGRQRIGRFLFLSVNFPLSQITSRKS